MRFAHPFALLAKSVALIATFGVLTAPAQAQSEGEADVCAFDTVIDLRTGVPTTAQRLLGEAANTQLVFLGERHGTPEHVALASCILDAKTGSRPPVLALEHVPASAQRDLDDWRRDSAFDTDLFADIVDWESLGWPDFNIYRPLIETAGNARAHVVATDRPQLGAGGPSFDALLEVAPAYGLQTAEIVDAWIPDMIAGHCGLIDEEAATRMALEQMERDQIMAGRLIAGRGRGPSTLYFGGKGHVRMDRAIPYLIDRTDRPPSMLTIAAYTVDEWERVLEEGPIREQGLNARYDLVVVAGESDPTDEFLCEQMRAIMGG
ncbi:MAG: ChaN family lipoprotein [Pseudomonadota bacterium]